jgi:glycosyltransferase involved in cell wall biosynthesis/GT2 family glycosyltransferase
MTIAIGIYVHAEPERLRATLASVKMHGPADAEVLLLPDGADPSTRAALAAPPFDALPQLGTDLPLGTAACWNRLVTASDADVVVLLESGALLAPGALHLLVAALSDPRHGLAGPSTNTVWNEQGAFPGALEHAEAVATTATLARRRFGDTVRPLTPLHSLADFCYVARRDVIDAVGAADEAYGLGPCWEMDYNIRAARAGFLGVWVCAAYVHRTRPTVRRRFEEERRFEGSRHHYQDKFCARRLRDASLPYHAHCEGDACADFAPPALLRIREAPGVVARAATLEPAPVGPAPPPPVIVSSDRPFLSCIMPTRDRRAWVPQAIRFFLRQDFTDSELVILDDGNSPVRDCVPDHPRIRYHYTAGQRTVGAKRNEACRLARGELIAHWDDDDWYGPSRLRRQVEALQSTSADLCGTSTLYFYQPSADRAWRYRFGGGKASRMLVGTSLVYRRRAWERSPFADIGVGEDVRFVRASGGPLCDLGDPALCVATIHAANTSPRTPDALFWQPHPAQEIHSLLGDDLAYYRQGAQPLVSCIMPTFNRRAFIPLSLARFVEQDWANRELVIVDDGSDPVEDLAMSTPQVRYLRLRQRTSIGEKRNIACGEARGELVAHWDDDDWYGPGRLSWQLAPILAGAADLTGLVNRFTLRLPAGDFWTTQQELHRRMFVGDIHGGTIVFRRSMFAEGLRYPAGNLAEDAALIREVMRRGRRVVQLENPGLFVYVRHGGNAWQFDVGRFMDPSGWRPAAGPPALSAQTVDAYRAAATGQG